jgi:hypothetical protein
MSPLIRLIACAALAGSASLAAVAVPSGIASAATPLTVTCTSLTGSATTQTISGCTGTAAIAADAGTPPAKGTSVASTKTITWSNHKTTKTTYTYKAGSDASCPTVAKYTKDLLENATGKVVSGGTAKGMVNGVFKGTICVYKLTAAPHTLMVRNKGSFKV